MSSQYETQLDKDSKQFACTFGLSYFELAASIVSPDESRTPRSLAGEAVRVVIRSCIEQEIWLPRIDREIATNALAEVISQRLAAIAA